MFRLSRPRWLAVSMRRREKDARTRSPIGGRHRRVDADAADRTVGSNATDGAAQHDQLREFTVMRPSDFTAHTSACSTEPVMSVAQTKLSSTQTPLSSQCSRTVLQRTVPGVHGSPALAPASPAAPALVVSPLAEPPSAKAPAEPRPPEPSALPARPALLVPVGSLSTPALAEGSPALPALPPLASAITFGAPLRALLPPHAIAHDNPKTHQ